VRLLANMAGLGVARLGNVFYVTAVENAKQMGVEQAQMTGRGFLGDTARPTNPASNKKPAK